MLDDYSIEILRLPETLDSVCKELLTVNPYWNNVREAANNLIDAAISSKLGTSDVIDEIFRRYKLQQ